MRTIKLLLILVICTLALVLSTSPAAAGDPFEIKDSKPFRALEIEAQNSGGGRVMVVTDGPITESTLEELSKHGRVHIVVDRYNLASVTPKGKKGRNAIEDLDFVTEVTNDGRLYLIDAMGNWNQKKANMVQISSGPALGIGMWDRDMINVVELSSAVGGNPDNRDVAETGDGVYVAVIDSGLPPDWDDWLDASRVDTNLARSFIGRGAVDEEGVPADPKKKPVDPPNLWQKDTDGHGLVVVSHIIGFLDTFDGVAPDAQIIPLKVFPNGQASFFESQLIAALAYVIDLKEADDIDKVVVNMSLSGPSFQSVTAGVIEEAVDDFNIILVGSAGNNGEDGMGFPGALEDVNSVGAVGFTKQFRDADGTGGPNDLFYRLTDVADSTDVNEVFVAPFSSRAHAGQHLDVVAPGVNTFAPDNPPQTSCCFFQFGTSFSAPLVSGVAALMLEKDGSLTPSEVECILEETALDLGDESTGAEIRSGVINRSGGPIDPAQTSWDYDCDGATCDADGNGLVQAKEALDFIDSGSSCP